MAIYFICGIALLLAFLMAVRVYRTWLHPSAFVAGTWALVMFLHGAAAWGFTTYAEPIWLVFFWILLFVASGILIPSKLGARHRYSAHPCTLGDHTLWRLMLLSLAGGAVGVVALLRALGRYGVAFKAASYVEVAATVASLRYSQDLAFPTATSIAMALAGAFALILGLAVGQRGWSTRRLLMAALNALAPLGISAVTTQRLPVFVVIANLIGGVLAGTVASQRRPRLLHAVSVRRLIVVSLVVSALAGSVIGLQFVRQSREQGIALDRIGRVVTNLQAWLAGYLPGYSIWFHDRMAEDVRNNAAYTHSFEGVLRLIGLDALAPPRHPLVSLGKGTQSTNAITAWRAFIYDFGIAGTTGLMCVLGLASAAVFYRAARGGPVALIMLSGVYASILWSVNYLLTAYGSQILAYLLALALTVYAKLRHRRTNPGALVV